MSSTRWVRERRTYRAEQRGRITAAAHLLRYRDTDDVFPSLRDAGEVKWLVCWPDAPYGPDAWPHVCAIYAEAGFTGGRRETVLVCRVPEPVGVPGADSSMGWTMERRLKTSGVRFAAVLDANEVGYLEVDANLGVNARFDRDTRWADIGNLYVDPDFRRRGIATSLPDVTWAGSVWPGCKTCSLTWVPTHPSRRRPSWSKPASAC